MCDRPTVLHLHIHYLSVGLKVIEHEIQILVSHSLLAQQKRKEKCNGQETDDPSKSCVVHESMIGELLSEFFLLVSLFQAVPNQWTSDEPKKDRSLVTNKQTSSDR